MKKALKVLVSSMLFVAITVTSMPVMALVNRLDMVGSSEWSAGSHRFEVEHPNLIGEIDGIPIFMVDSNVESLTGNIHFTEIIDMYNNIFNVNVDATFTIIPSEVANDNPLGVKIRL